MKATVWTSWNLSIKDHESRKPKCIFIGEIASVPRVGEYVVVKDGFGAETVTSVIHDFVTGEVEISVNAADPGNAYGPCLFDKKEPPCTA